MTETKIRKIRMTDEEWEALRVIGEREGKERSAVMIAAIKDKYPDDFKPAQRKEGRPQGWKGILYRDRYQLVATWTGKDGFDFCHFHELDKPIEKSRQFGVIRAETPVPSEIYILDVPAGYDHEEVAGELRLALLEWWGNQEDQGKL